MKRTPLNDLRQARELLETEILGFTLDALLTALYLEHPTLANPPQCREPPSLRYARDLVDLLCAVGCTLHTYRRAVRTALRPSPPRLPKTEPYF